MEPGQSRGYLGVRGVDAESRRGEGTGQGHVIWYRTDHRLRRRPAVVKCRVRKGGPRGKFGSMTSKAGKSEAGHGTWRGGPPTESDHWLCPHPTVPTERGGQGCACFLPACPTIRTNSTKSCQTSKTQAGSLHFTNKNIKGKELAPIFLKSC